MIDSAKLQKAVDYTLANETSWSRDTQTNWGVHQHDPAPWNTLHGPVYPRGGVSGVVRVGGQQIVEWGEPQRTDQTFSIAKTYLALLAGVAVQRGLLGDLNEPVRARVRCPGFESERNAKVTWLQLLQQTSEWEGECFGIADQVDRNRHLQYQPPRAVGKKGEARPLHAPGTYWEYNDVRINQLALALLYLFRRPLPEVFTDTITAPLGIGNTWRWEGYDDSWVVIDGVRMQSVPGGTHWGGGVSISARDQAQIGQLMLDGGRANGQQIVPAQWIQQMTTPSAIAPWYGYLVWLNELRGVFPAASKASYFLVGAGASFVWVDPDRALVAVVRWIEGSAMNGFCELLTEAVPAK